jgi:predicted nucleic acid-binding protein
VAGAIGRRERTGALAGADASRALASLAELAETWIECSPSERVRATARRIVQTHDVRTADAMQVAAATVLSDGEPASLPLVTLDDRLALAARREGFPVLP